MSEEANLAITLLVIMPLIIIAWFIYYSSSRLSHCGVCGRQLSMQADRGWIKLDGKNHPVCSKCVRKAKT